MKWNLKKLAPWNWFRKEQQRQAELATSASARARSSAVAAHPLIELQREVDRLFESVLGGSGLSGWAGMPMPAVDGWLKPVLDIEETERTYRITLEIPGVEKDDVEILVDGDLLTIRGEKRQEKRSDEGDFHRIERSYGAFRRELNLPDDADPDSIEASFRNGVLTITIGKREQEQAARGRLISIKG